MTLAVDVYYSFRSPYSYLATPRIREIACAEGVEFNVRVVLPIAVRTPDFFKQVNPMWPPYLMKDVHRLGEYLGVPFRWPRPDPVVMDRETMTFPAEQPFIWRISRLGVAAQERGAGMEFTCAAAAKIWDGEVENWHEGDHLADAARIAGLDLEEMETAIAADTARFDALIEANQESLKNAGHWGVPTFVFRGEPFFGQDRLDVLLWRLREAGLSAKPSK